MTIIVASAIGDTPDELYARVRTAAETADWVEVRLDTPGGLPWDLRAFFSVHRPCIATVRHADEGGGSHADDATRADILRRAIRAGARAIDIEDWHEHKDALIREAHEMGARVILSQHFGDTPDADTLIETLREMRAAGADWCKIATRIENAEDAAVLVRTATQARGEGIPAALMAVNDPFMRLMAPALGMPLAYASVPGAEVAAPGQLPTTTLRDAHRTLVRPPTTTNGRTAAAFLLGHPVAHSKSPQMHEAAFATAGIDARYLALDVRPEDLSSVIDGLFRAGTLGVQLTVPHKIAAMDLVDELDASAREAGAVNTIIRHDGRRIGHNTDGDGAIDALHEAGVRLTGIDALVLGAGGAARGIARALQGAGARVILTNRTLEKAQALAAEIGSAWLPWDEVAKALPRVGLVVNATTVGLIDDASPIDVGHVVDAAIFDAVYRTGGTRLIRDARARGLTVVPGESMLLHQGARAFALLTGRPAPIEAMRGALEATE